MNILSIVYLCIIYFAYPTSKWNTEYLNTTFLLVLFASAHAADVSSTVITSLTSIYASPQSPKIDFSIVVLNLI